MNELLNIKDDHEIIQVLDASELKLLHTSYRKSFELFQILTDLKSKIQLREKQKVIEVQAKKTKGSSKSEE